MKLGFYYRAIIGVFSNFFDNPKIDKKLDYFSIGKTLNGEEIKCYKFGNNGEKILYFGGIHGNEIGTIKLMSKWTNFLSKNKKIYKKKQIFVIPCLNTDGYKKALNNKDYLNGGTIGKTNSNNVDLNRNFPTNNWSEKTKLFVSGKYYNISGGKFPASEPEIKNLLNFIEKEQIKIIYVYHNCWGTVMGTFTNSSDKKVRRYSGKSYYKIFTKKDWNYLKKEQKTGHGTIWGIEKNIDFIEIEMKYRWSSEWNKNKKALIDSLK